MRKPIVAHRRDGAVPVLSSLPKTPTGVSGLDEITVGGLPKGRTTLVCGGAGCGKTLLGMEFLVRGATQFGEAGVCISFEETPEELASNVASIGIGLEPWIAKGLLRFHAERPTAVGLEMHLVRMHRVLAQFRPRLVVLDPVTALAQGGSLSETQTMLLRLVDMLKAWGITAMMTTLTQGDDAQGPVSYTHLTLP